MKRFMPLLIISLFIFALCSTAYAWAPKVEGKPGAFDPGSTRGYFIWHDDNGLHMLTTTRGVIHHFSGVIKTDGQFLDVHGNRTETDDWFTVGPQMHEMKFDFTTSSGQDGVNFKIEGGSYMSLNLFLDGYAINSNEIYIGNSGWHPEQSSFTLYR